MIMKEKTFTTPSGLNLKQLGTFVFYIKGIGFRFVVTQEHPSIAPAVTHRVSGFKVRDIGVLQLQACSGDIVGAAKLTLKRLIEVAGEDRVFQKLKDAEK